jgi:hypothetical protein
MLLKIQTFSTGAFTWPNKIKNKELWERAGQETMTKANSTKEPAPHSKRCAL